jgi:hypothetical protein
MKNWLKIISIYIVPLVIGASIFGICIFLEKIHLVSVVDFYQRNMRGSLFAGFLTLGSFLLSLKTGIVIKIKENVYDKDTYQKKVDEAQEQGIKVTVYGPLRRLSAVLSAAVFAALLAAALQLTVGLFSVWWTAAICLSAAGIALTLLLTAFVLIQANLSKWFEFLEEEAVKAKEKRDISASEALEK